MSSIILPVGQCGNQIGHELMTLLDNHSSRHPLGHRDGKVRCVCVDSEPKVIRHVVRSDQRHHHLFREENMIVGQTGRGNNFAMGYYGNGDITKETSLLNRTVEAMRKEVERCDYFAGTLVIHSLTGGTGSGLGSRLVETLRDTFPLAYTASVAVSPHLSGDSPLQHYNSLLSLATLQRNADCITVFSNDDVLRHLISHMSSTAKQQTSSNVSLKQMNQLIAASLAGVLLPLGEKPQKITSSKSNKSTLRKSDKNTSSIMKQSYRHSLSETRKSPHSLPVRSGRNLWSASSMISTVTSCSDSSTLDDSIVSMQRQPRATISALMRYRGITSEASSGPSQSRTEDKFVSSEVEFDKATRGSEHWEMLRSVCPEPSKKFATIHHLAKSKCTWESLTQSLLHSTHRYDKDGKQFSSLNALLIARGTGESPFIDSLAKIEERLKTSLGCVEWNPFPIDYWISKYSGAGSYGAQSLTLCLNSSRIIDFLQNTMGKAKTMYEVGAYVHWYEKHGCSKDDFYDAFSTLNDVVDEYRLGIL